MMRKIILAVLVIFFLVSFNGFVAINAVNSSVLDADSLHNALKASKAYETLYDKAVGSILGSIPGSSIISIDQIKQMLPVSVFEELFRQILTGLTAYLKDPNITAPVAKISMGGLGTQTVDLSDYTPEGTFQNLKAIVQIMLSIMYVLLAAAVVFLILMIVIAKTFASKLKVVGSAFFVSGLSLIALSFSLPYIVPAVMPLPASPQFAAAQLIINAVVSGISSTILMQAAIILAAGIALVAGSIIVKKKGAQKPAKAEPAEKKPAKPKPKAKKSK